MRKCFYHDIYSTKVCKNKNMQLQTIRPENKNYVLFCIVPGKVFLILAKKHSFFSLKCMYIQKISKNKTLVMIIVSFRKIILTIFFKFIEPLDFLVEHCVFSTKTKKFSSSMYPKNRLSRKVFSLRSKHLDNLGFSHGGL